MSTDPEIQRSSNRLRSLITRAAPNLVRIQERAARHQAQLPQLLQIVDLLRRQQAYEEASKQQSAEHSPQRAIIQPIWRDHDRFQRDRKNETAFLHKLSPLDFRGYQNGLMVGYCEVRNWFFGSPQYMEWSRGKAWHLSCYGEPRCGKTKFAAAVARQIQVDSLASSAAVVSLYLGKDGPFQSTCRLQGVSAVQATMATILRQLVEDKLGQRLSSALLSSLGSDHAQTIDLSPSNVRDHVLAEVENLDKVFVLVDGLDSLDEGAQDALKVELLNLNKLPHVRLMFVQSRTDPLDAVWIKCNRACQGAVTLYWHCAYCNNGDFHICHVCYDQGHRCLEKTHVLEEPYQAVEIPLRTPPEELVKYLHDELQKAIHDDTDLGRRLDNAKDVVRNIENTMAAKSAGIFVLAKLYMSYITHGQTLDNILDVLERLPKEEIGYFDDLMDEVVDQTDEDDRNAALAALALVAVACYETRPLSFDELAAALQNLLSTPSEAMTQHRLLRITKGLLMTEVRTTIEVKPFHMAVGTYLSEHCEDRFEELGLDMAQLCLNSIDTAGPMFKDSANQQSAFLKILDDQPFVQYALQHWGQHLRSNECSKADASALAFLDKYDQPSLSLCPATFSAFAYGDVFRYGWPGSHSLHLWAWFGLGRPFPDFPKRDQNSNTNIADAVTGRTPLHIAIIRGHEDVVKILLDAGADLSRTCNQGRTALWEAVASGSLPIVSAILKRCDAQTLNAVNNLSPRETALMAAVKLPNHETAEILIRCPKSDLSIQDERGRTALYLAAEVGNAKVLQQMVAQSECKNYVNLCDSLGGRNALMALLNCQQWDDNAWIGDDDGGGASASEVGRGAQFKCLKLLVENGADICIRDKHHRTLLHYAAWDETRLSSLKYLLQKKMNINSIDAEGNTSLHVAAASLQPSVKVVQTLLDNGADVTAKDLQGRTPYDVALLYQASHVAASLEPVVGARSSELAEMPLWAQIMFKPDSFLETHGHELNSIAESEILQTDSLGYTLLHCAIIAESSPIARLLLKSGRLNVNARNVDGQTVLHLATVLPKLEDSTRGEMINLLLDHTCGLDLDSVDYQGHCALQLAVEASFTDIALDLINRGAYISISRKQMRPLLSRAIDRKDLQAVRALVGAGADVFAYPPQRRPGKLPSQVAEEDGAGEALVRVLGEAEWNIFQAFTQAGVPARIDSGLPDADTAMDS